MKKYFDVFFDFALTYAIVQYIIFLYFIFITRFWKLSRLFDKLFLYLL